MFCHNKKQKLIFRKNISVDVIHPLGILTRFLSFKLYGYIYLISLREQFYLLIQLVADTKFYLIKFHCIKRKIYLLSAKSISEILED